MGAAAGRCAGGVGRAGGTGRAAISVTHTAVSSTVAATATVTSNVLVICWDSELPNTALITPGFSGSLRGTNATPRISRHTATTDRAPNSTALTARGAARPVPLSANQIAITAAITSAAINAVLLYGGPGRSSTPVSATPVILSTAVPPHHAAMRISVDRAAAGQSRAASPDLTAATTAGPTSAAAATQARYPRNPPRGTGVLRDPVKTVQIPPDRQHPHQRGGQPRRSAEHHRGQSRRGATGDQPPSRDDHRHHRDHAEQQRRDRGHQVGGSGGPAETGHHVSGAQVQVEQSSAHTRHDREHPSTRHAVAVPGVSVATPCAGRAANNAPASPSQAPGPTPGATAPVPVWRTATTMLTTVNPATTSR